MEITSPSGRVYQWNKAEPPTEDDIKALQEHDAALGGSAPVAEQAKPGKYADDPEVDLETGAKGLFKAAFGGGTANDKAAYDTLRDADHSLGASATARYGLPLLGSMGGGVGAAAGAGGEEIAQFLENGKINNPGAVTKAGIMGAIPLSKAKGIISTLWNAAKMGAGSAAGTEASSLVNEGKLADAGDVVKDAAIGGAIPVGAAMVGRVAGKIMGNVAPEEAARVASEKLNNAEKDAVLAKMQAQGAVTPPSAVNPSLKNKMLESVAGIENVQNAASRNNQPIFNKIGREEASMPGQSISEDNLKAARGDIASTSYAEARKMGFGDELDQWRSAGTKLKEAEKKLNAGYTQERGQAVDNAEKELASAEAALTAKANTPDALQIMQDAKQAFAKNYDVDQAVLSGTGDVRPSILSGMLAQRGEVGLSGGLRDIAQFNNAFGRSAKNVNKIATAPGAASAAVPVLAAASSHTPGGAALAGGIPVLRESIRDMLLSPGYQAKNAVRNYTPKTSADPAIIAAIIREMEQAAIDRKEGR